MFTKYIEFVFFSFLLVLSCQKKYQFDLSEITETDLNGNLTSHFEYLSDYANTPNTVE